MSRRLLAPFAGLRVAPDHADAVAAAPYDVLSRAEARAAVEGRPWSFLHVSRPEIDLPPETPEGASALYDGAAAAFSRMIEHGVLIRDASPRFFAYRMASEGRTQTGLVAAASLPAYEVGAIKRHESTRPPKVEDRARHIAALGAQTGPLLLIHRPDEACRRLIGGGLRRAAALQRPARRCRDPHALADRRHRRDRGAGRAFRCNRRALHRRWPPPRCRCSHGGPRSGRAGRPHAHGVLPPPTRCRFWAITGSCGA